MLAQFGRRGRLVIVVLRADDEPILADLAAARRSGLDLRVRLLGSGDSRRFAAVSIAGDAHRLHGLRCGGARHFVRTEQLSDWHAQRHKLLVHLLQLSLSLFLAGIALQPLGEFFRQLLLQVCAVVDRLRECLLTALARDKCGEKRRLRLSLSQMHQNKQTASFAGRIGLPYLKVRTV